MENKMDDKDLLNAIAQIVQAETKPIKDDLTDVKTRLTNLEDHVGSIEADLSEVKNRTGRVEVLLEHDIPKQINILSEGHSAILERLPEANELDALRARIRTAERVLTVHTEEINQLKHAN